MADPQGQQPAAPVPMFDVDGQVRNVPYEKMTEAAQNGMKPAVSVTFPGEKQARWVPADKLPEATSQENGGKINPLEDQQAQHPGAWQHILSMAWGGAKGMIENVLDPEGVVTGSDPVGDVVRQKASEQKAGYGPGYQAAAEVAGSTGVTSPAGMEQSAKQGDVKGVATQALGSTAMALAPSVVGHVGGALMDHPMVKSMMDNMTPAQLHQSLSDFLDDFRNNRTYKGSKLSPKGVLQQLWEDESGEAKVPGAGGSGTAEKPTFRNVVSRLGEALPEMKTISSDSLGHTGIEQVIRGKLKDGMSLEQVIHDPLVQRKVASTVNDVRFIADTKSGTTTRKVLSELQDSLGTADYQKGIQDKYAPDTQGSKDYQTFYHGTTSDRVQAIQEQGLRGVDEPELIDRAERVPGNSRDGAYLTSDPKYASQFAHFKSATMKAAPGEQLYFDQQLRGTKKANTPVTEVDPVVVKLRLPKELVSTLAKDPQTDASRVAPFIDPKFIEGIQKASPRQASILSSPEGPKSSTEAGGSGTAAGAARDTSTLKQVQQDHPDWTLSQQLQEAAKRVNPNPGAAALHDPAFESTPAKGQVADYLNSETRSLNGKNVVTLADVRKLRNAGKVAGLGDAYKEAVGNLTDEEYAGYQHTAPDQHALLNLQDSPELKAVKGLHNQLVNTVGTADVTGTLSPDKVAVIKDMLDRYASDPHFKAVADAARHYVHNNSALVNAGRIELGMEPLVEPESYEPKFLGHSQAPTLKPGEASGIILQDGQTFELRDYEGHTWNTESEASEKALHAQLGKSIKSIYMNGWKMTPEEFKNYVQDGADPDVLGRPPTDYEVHNPIFGPGWDASTIDRLDGTKDNVTWLTKEEARPHVHAILDAIRGAEPTTTPLYRGMSVRSLDAANYLKGLKPGDELALPLSSFSESLETSKGFYGSGHNVNLQLEGPHQSLNVQPFSHFPEGEHVVNGAFEVVKSEKGFEAGRKTGADIILTLRQKGTY
jgi:hypothetical protein